MKQDLAQTAKQHLQGWLNHQSWTVGKSPKVEVKEVMGEPYLEVTMTGFQDTNWPTSFRTLSVVYKKGVDNERTGNSAVSD